MRRPERARHEESTGPKRLDETRCQTFKRRINFHEPSGYDSIDPSHLFKVTFLHFVLSHFRLLQVELVQRTFKRIRSREPLRERVLYWQPTGPNPLNHRDDFSGPAWRHGSLKSPFQVAFYLPSWQTSLILQCCSHTTRWRTNLSSKGNLHHAINFRGTCGATWVT